MPWNCFEGEKRGQAFAIFADSTLLREGICFEILGWPMDFSELWEERTLCTLSQVIHC